MPQSTYEIQKNFFLSLMILSNMYPARKQESPNGNQNKINDKILKYPSYRLINGTNPNVIVVIIPIDAKKNDVSPCLFILTNLLHLKNPNKKWGILL